MTTEKTWAREVPEINVATFLKNSLFHIFRMARIIIKNRNITAILSGFPHCYSMACPLTPSIMIKTYIFDANIEEYESDEIIQSCDDKND
jgi:hypothetical protein